MSTPIIILLSFLCFVVFCVIALVTGLYMWAKKKGAPPAPPTPTTGTPPTTPHGAGHGAPHASGGGKMATFWLWFGGIATAVLGVICIIWFCDYLSSSKPERKEWSGYYQYWIEYPDGNIRQGDQVFVKVTPNSVSTSYAAEDGGRESLEWGRGGDGVWTKIQNRRTSATYFRVTNGSSDPERDFQRWKGMILGEVGNEKEPTKKDKITLIRQ